MKPRVPALFAILFIITGLSGCGFQARGTTATLAHLSPLYVAGLEPFSRLRNELIQTLQQSEVQLTTTRATANRVLELSNRVRDRRLLAVDPRGKSAESELEESLRFRLTNNQGEEVLAWQKIQILRSYFDPETEVLGRRNEETLLRAEMRSQLIHQLTQRLATQTH